MVMASAGANKCGTMGKLGCRKGKKGQPMDGVVMKHCSGILKKLMTHPAGWVFNQPVDPVKLNIPDYFSIISEPMDLGTIKSKLENRLYLNAQEFAADVRLTFSNAMRYNPPQNEVHIIAKELNGFFNLRWKSLEATWRVEGSITLELPVLKKTQKQTLNSRRSGHRTSPNCSTSSPRKSMTFTEKHILRKDLAELLDGNTPPHLLKFLRRFGSVGQSRDRIKVDFDALDDEALWELDRIIKSCPESRSAKSTDVDNRCAYGSKQELLRGKGGSNSYHNSKDYTPMSPAAACRNGSCDSMDCRCSHHNDFTQASSSGRKDRACHASNLDRLACKNSTASTQWSNDPDSDCGKGFGGGFVEENFRPSPGSAMTGTMDLHYDEQLSPSKALRAAMLRSRFADTIVKAQQKTLLNNGEKGDALKMQQEREKLEKKEQEVKARMEAQVRAAEAARMRAEARLKMQREREREAARIALQKMEKTVDIDENQEILKDLEMLVYSQPNHHQPMMAMAIDGCYLNPLERLGLFMKNDDLEDEADWISGSS
ncbi:transcription factor GTE8-like [Magnolia sinica]|uniref:transcription factor GTE8-like n=1 Tax=Magnolia sinica TaxID=86752 RepID=UPI00265B3D2D|nr:transcription factor GTE8-like [Magnolia sinica]XP_058084471.1 transcription factor GTE8-like [Magnolia sinica]XP_058084473.1 transcription factor GTE8-like [Magnolia sinica]XP_058084474.1 transcription factor GTE8-like [Magnolia sinica]XP_058084475.1 transcription factor GTE8-like [Magnolia sinica]